MDPFQRGGSQSLSMREKSVLKRRINREHNSNFRAGYIPINEEYLHKSGIRGRKSDLFCLIMVFLVILAVLNAVVTAGVLYLLRFTHVGLTSMEFMPDSGLLRFLMDTHISTVHVVEGSIGSLANQSLLMEGNDIINFDVSLPSSNPGTSNNASLKMNVDNIVMQTSGAFDIKNPVTKKVLFSTNDKMSWEMLEPGLNLHAQQIEVEAVRSMPSVAKELMVESEKSLSLMGMEGVQIESQESYVALSAQENIYVQSEDTGIVISGDKGIYLNKYLPTPGTDGSKLDPTLLTYKLCVCMPSGEVYSIVATENCDDRAGICSSK